MSELVKFALLRRRAGLDHGQFSQHWRRVHARVLIRSGHREYNRTYVQNHLSALPGHPEPPFDGAAQMLQADEGNAAVGFQEDPRYGEQVRPDELRFMDVDHSVALFTRARRIAGPGDGGSHKLLAFIRRPARIAAGSLGPLLDAAGSGAVAAHQGRELIAEVVHHDVVAFGQRGRAATATFDAIVEWRLASFQGAADAAQLLDGMLTRSGLDEGSVRALATEVVVY